MASEYCCDNGRGSCVLVTIAVVMERLLDEQHCMWLYPCNPVAATVHSSIPFTMLRVCLVLGSEWLGGPLHL